MWQKWDTETFDNVNVNGRPLMVVKANGPLNLSECFQALQKDLQQQPHKAAKFFSGQKLLHSFTLFSPEQPAEKPAVSAAPQGILYTNGGFTSLIVTDGKDHYYYNLFNGAAAANDVKTALAPSHFHDVSGSQSTAAFAAVGYDPASFAEIKANIARNLLQGKPGNISSVVNYAVDHIRAAQDHKPAPVSRMSFGGTNE